MRLSYLSNQPVTSSDPIREHEAELEQAIDTVYRGSQTTSQHS